MEWLVAQSPEPRSVVVPDPYVITLIEIVRATAIPLDPYRDNVLGEASIRTIRTRLQGARDELRLDVANTLKRELGVADVPAWAADLVDKRMSEQPLIGVCQSLIELCDHALRCRSTIRILGQ